MAKNINMSVEEFSNVIEEFLEEEKIQLLIKMPEGTLEPVITDNCHLGVVPQYYILINAMSHTIGELMETVSIPPENREPCIDALLEMIKDDLINKDSSVDESKGS